VVELGFSIEQDEEGEENVSNSTISSLATYGT
jgi:hypothetical protein